MVWFIRIFLEDLPRKTGYNKALCVKAFDIAKNPKYDEIWYQHELALMLCNFLNKKSAMHANKSAATHTGTELNSNSDSENQQLAEELPKLII